MAPFSVQDIKFILFEVLKKSKHRCNFLLHRDVNSAKGIKREGEIPSIDKIPTFRRAGFKIKNGPGISF